MQPPTHHTLYLLTILACGSLPLVSGRRGQADAGSNAGDSSKLSSVGTWKIGSTLKGFRLRATTRQDSVRRRVLGSVLCGDW